MSEFTQILRFNGPTIIEFWPDFVTGSVNKNLPVQYLDQDDKYTIFSIDGLILRTCTIFKSGSFIKLDDGYSSEKNDIDREDFENNFKTKIDTKGSFDKQQIKTKRFDIGSTTIFVGEGANGTATNENSWTIKKITLEGGSPISTQVTSITASWDNRTAETYS